LIQSTRTKDDTLRFGCVTCNAVIRFGLSVPRSTWFCTKWDKHDKGCCGKILTTAAEKSGNFGTKSTADEEKKRHSTSKKHNYSTKELSALLTLDTSLKDAKDILQKCVQTHVTLDFCKQVKKQLKMRLSNDAHTDMRELEAYVEALNALPEHMCRIVTRTAPEMREKFLEDEKFKHNKSEAKNKKRDINYRESAFNKIKALQSDVYQSIKDDGVYFR